MYYIRRHVSEFLLVTLILIVDVILNSCVRDVGIVL